MKWIFCLSIFLFASQFSAYGQKSLRADIDSKGKISLQDAPVVSSYELELAKLPFENFEKAQSHFQNLNIEDLRFSLNEKTQTLTIHLNIAKNFHWTRSMWTSYLARHLNFAPSGK